MAERAGGKGRASAILWIASLTIIGLIGCGAATPQPTATPRPVIREAWISGTERCPSHPDYGDQVVEYANAYSDRHRSTENLQRVPHGARVDILDFYAPDSVYLVRWGDVEGWVSNIFVVSYNPREETHPDEDFCP